MKIAKADLWVWKKKGVTDQMTHSILSDVEQHRLQGLPMDRRESFTEGRVAIRTALGAFLNMSPKDVPIEIESSGKPMVSASDTFFSLSHSHEVFAFALANIPVGVDLEWINPSRDLAKISTRSFGSLVTDPNEFFLRWSMMEAHTKLLGESAFKLMPYSQAPHRDQEWVFAGSAIWIRSKIIPGSYALSLAVQKHSDQEIELTHFQDAPF